MVANGLNEKAEEWEEVEFLVDSGASATVISEDMVKAVSASEPNHSRRYRLADGSTIPSLGTKRFKGVTNEGAENILTASVTKVGRHLLSVAQLVPKGGKVVFAPANKGGCYIETAKGNSKIGIEHNAGLFMLQLWVPRGHLSLPRQG